MSTDSAPGTDAPPTPRAALVVDASPVSRQLLSLLLAPRFDLVVAREDASQVLDALQREGPFDLLLLDLEAPGDPFLLLEEVRELSMDRPAVLALTRHPSLDLETQVSLSGAIGFLAKPITPRALFRALRFLDGSNLAAAAPRALLAQGDVSAEVLDTTSGEILLRWEVRDISRNGALLLSHGPAALGQLLQLRLQLGRETVETTAEVVRVQEPAWGVVPGLAVRFLEIDPRAENALDAFVRGWGLER